MKMTTRFARSGTAQRGAFTMIELLVVITIIVALMALMASAALKLIEVQQTTNTQSTLDRVQSQLTRAWSKVKDEAYKETIPPAIYTAIQSSLTMPDANAPGRIRVIYVKLKLRAAFPMNFSEALNLPYTNPTLGAMGYNPVVGQSPVPALPGYVSFLSNLGITGSTGASYESSACLLMALQRGASGAGINPDDLTTGGAAGSVVTPSGNNLPYLNDAWGRPIFFSRAPTGSLYLNPAGAMAGANDPGDPQGYLQTPTWGVTYGPVFTPLTLQVVAPANMSFKLAPMVASGGPVNWLSKPWGTNPAGTPTLNPITFAPVTGYDALFSTP